MKNDLIFAYFVSFCVRVTKPPPKPTRKSPSAEQQEKQEQKKNQIKGQVATVVSRKNIQDYSSDEDIPLSVRQKLLQDRQRAERSKRRRVMVWDSDSDSDNDHDVDSDSEIESESSSSESNCSDDESEESTSSIVERIRRRRRGSAVGRYKTRPLASSIVSDSSSSSSSNSNRSSSSSICRRSRKKIKTGWEEEVVQFKEQLRMPKQLINVSRPRNAPPDRRSTPQSRHQTRQMGSMKRSGRRSRRSRRTSSATMNKLPNKCRRNGGRQGRRRRQRLLVFNSFSWARRWSYRMFRKSLLFAVQVAEPSRSQRASVAASIALGSSQVGSVPRKTKVEKADTAIGGTDKASPAARAVVAGKRRRRRFRSGFDYIRRKIKKSRKQVSAGDRPDEPTKSVKTNNKDYQLVGATLDAALEIRSWVLNKCLGETALHRATRLGYFVRLSSFIFPIDCLSVMYPGCAPVYLIWRQSIQQEGVRYLLQQPETRVSARDNAGYTPLHVACSKGRLAVARILLQYGADESCSANGGIR